MQILPSDFFLLIYFPITLSNAPHTQPQFSFINIYSSRVVVPNCIIGAFCTTFCKPFGKHSHDASRSPLWRSNEGRTTCVRDRFYGTFIAGFCRTHVSRLSSCERARKVVTHCHPFHAVSRLVYKLVTATQTSGLPLGFCCLDYKLARLLTLTARDTNQYCQYYSICHNGRFHASASLISSAAKPTNELQTYVNKPRWNLFAVY